MPELDSAKHLSKVFFGRESCLATWHAVMSFSVDPPEPFRAKEIFDKMYPDANAGMIGRELRILVTAGAIALMPELDVYPSRYYRRLESGLWPVVAELANRTIELSSTPDSQK
ncbi:MAG TPA: hypothetical protein VGE34_03880 [Candidatus Saccharimonadales bacterium]